MCDPISTVIAGVVGAGGAIASGIQASNAAGAQADYNAEVEALQKQYRLDVMAYQNADYANNVKFYKDQIAWEQGEFEKTKTHVSDQIEAVNDDMFSKLGQQMTQVVQQDIAMALGIQTVDTQAREERGKLEATVADSGIGGNTVNILRGDIDRQAGNARTVYDMNDTAARQQISNEMRGSVAQRNNALASLTIPTFQPLQAPAPPAPVSPVSPAAPASRPSAATIGLNALSSGINLYSTVSKLL
jgi:hypothetical protein